MVKKILCCLALAMAAKNGFADYPFISNSASTEYYRDWSLYLYSTMYKTHSDNAIVAPALEFDYGITPYAEVDLIVPMALNVPVHGGSPRAYGFGDVQLAVDYPLIYEHGSWPQIAFTPSVVFPTGNPHKDLGNGEIWASFPLWIQKSWGLWTGYGGGGCTVNHAPGRHNYYYGGIVVQRLVTDRLMLGGEIYSQGSSGLGNSAFTLFDFGGSYAFTKRAGVLFSLGHNFLGAPHIYVFVGGIYTS